MVDFRPEELDDSHPYYSVQKEMPALSKNHAGIIKNLQ